ncbi:MAG: N-acetylmuramoyl-L-alanine amidase [Gemmatimonadetes bacterium]|nr:N-acetylmuramoyl-L-alanine amidase [Gemmatimonadota bacterium]MDE3257589.1 N-acetylmuramoyl-L-alanine amidase [Gemmatimonadota bacterium]
MRLLIAGLCLVMLCASPLAGLSLVYKVRKGDSLWSIAQKHQTSIGAIKRINKLRTNNVYPGQVLRLTPRIAKYSAENGPYYYLKPRAGRQKHRNYREPSRSSPRTDYARARTLLQAFDAQILANAPRKRRQPLKGWRIVLDPGHGGIDPGAIVSNTTGTKRRVYVVEDEYVYDIALRMYKKLRLMGAEVALTVISPNHLIRDNLPASTTFVHEQNEVYNDERYNRRNSEKVRPRSANLSQRVRVANRFFKKARKGRCLFVSLHADNTPGRTKGPLVIYHKRRGKVDRRSRSFARVMRSALHRPNMPAGDRGRNLAVLRNNLAYAEILVEVHNVHHKHEAWLIRRHPIREQNADRVVKGILAYAKKRR